LAAEARRFDAELKSLRRYDPDQVRRVDVGATAPRLSAKRHPVETMQA